MTHPIRAPQAEKRLVLVEEFTGTWCGWCPHAMYLLDSLKLQNYKICVLAYHESDEMAIDEVWDFLNLLSTGDAMLNKNLSKTTSTLLGFPCAAIDRSYFPGRHSDPQSLTMYDDHFEASIADRSIIDPTFSIDKFVKNLPIKDNATLKHIIEKTKTAWQD